MTKKIIIANPSSQALPVTYLLLLALFSPFAMIFSALKEYAVSNWKSMLKISLAVGSLAFAILFIFYIAGINSETRDRYLIQKYEKKLSVLVSQNQEAETRLAKENNFSSMEDLVSKTNFEKVGKINYIKILENQVSVKY